MLEAIYPWMSIIGAILFIVLFLYCILLNVKLVSLSKKYNYFMQGEKGISLDRKLAVEVKEIRDTAESLESLFTTQKELEKVQHSSFQKIGFVEYNAFENIGNELSFSLTLLDGENNGLVISSVYGRNESRIFGKPIIEGKCTQSVSQEEMESIERAIRDKSNKESLITVSGMK